MVAVGVSGLDFQILGTTKIMSLPSRGIRISNLSSLSSPMRHALDAVNSAFHVYVQHGIASGDADSFRWHQWTQIFLQIIVSVYLKWNLFDKPLPCPVVSTCFYSFHPDIKGGYFMGCLMISPLISKRRTEYPPKIHQFFTFRVEG